MMWAKSLAEVSICFAVMLALYCRKEKGERILLAHSLRGKIFIMMAMVLNRE